MQSTDSPELQQTEAKTKSRDGIFVFFATLACLAALRLVIAFVPAPLAMVQALSIVVTIIFVAAPIFALFRAASSPWSPKLAMAFIVGGVVVHVGLALLAGSLPMSFLVPLLISIAQIGLVTWCVGLGALLTTKLKDKNLLIPVTIFLGGFDLFLVFSPVGPTRMIMQAAPKVLPAVGYAIPKIITAPSAAPVAPYAIVGPADFVFMAMFFVALYRFDMRPRPTFLALVPTLLAYLILSAFLGSIPLLPPIALVVLIVNLREFKLNKEELASTIAVAVLCAGLVIWGLTRPKPPSEPEKPAPVPAVRGSAN